MIIDALICINKYIYIYREREHQGDTKLGHESSIIIRNDTNFTSSDLYRSTLIDNMICFQRRWLVFVSFLSRERVERGNGCRKFPRFVIVRFPIQERERKKGTVPQIFLVRDSSRLLSVVDSHSNKYTFHSFCYTAQKDIGSKKAPTRTTKTQHKNKPLTKSANDVWCIFINIYEYIKSNKTNQVRALSLSLFFF